MNRSLAIKLGAIALLILLLLIPLLMIGGVISDRQQLRDGFDQQPNPGMRGRRLDHLAVPWLPVGRLRDAACPAVSREAGGLS